MSDDKLSEHLKDREWRLENVYSILNITTGETRTYKRPLVFLPRNCGKTALLKTIKEDMFS